MRVKLWILLLTSIISGFVVGYRAGWAMGLAVAFLVLLIGFSSGMLLRGIYYTDASRILGTLLCAVVLIGGYGLMAFLFVSGIWHFCPHAVTVTPTSAFSLAGYASVLVFIVAMLDALVGASLYTPQRKQEELDYFEEFPML